MNGLMSSVSPNRTNLPIFLPSQASQLNLLRWSERTIGASWIVSCFFASTYGLPRLLHLKQEYRVGERSGQEQGGRGHTRCLLFARVSIFSRHVLRLRVVSEKLLHRVALNFQT